MSVPVNKELEVEPSKNPFAAKLRDFANIHPDAGIREIFKSLANVVDAVDADQTKSDTIIQNTK